MTRISGAGQCPCSPWLRPCFHLKASPYLMGESGVSAMAETAVGAAREIEGKGLGDGDGAKEVLDAEEGARRCAAA